ncbi:hypothetical protein [Flavobacterium frigoris]|uniref:Uncharacterized protein n=1 Tax=Flavobacterium frigoris TaxID=229204 RepID=A0A1H9HI91_FLAFI|nr:hypothetical protein [Flavobacterium frigoris]SEQ61942.1 hypothetical protein SAMN05444355_103144 [Flavobacterium frigoris]
MPKLKINIFGEGIEVRQLQLDADIYAHWTEIASRKKRSLTDLLLDPFFYHQLKDNRFTSILDLDATVVSGVLDKPKNQIEFWFNRHKVLKLKPNELFNELVLFPLYQVDKNQLFNSNQLETGLYIMKKEIGLISCLEFEIATNLLQIDDFKFITTKFKNERFLSDIKYQNKHLNAVKNDTAITYQTSFEIK